MKKVLIFLIVLIIVTLTVVGVLLYINEDPVAENTEESNEISPDRETNKEANKFEATEGLYIVPTMRDKLYADTVWCATFQLVWNDMKNELVKKDVVFEPQLEVAENLNKEEFTDKMISGEYYYKKYGLKTLELKAEIEEGIKKKFNETSDILDDFDWSEEGLNDPNNPNVNRYFFYVMLRRSFEFLTEFDELENGAFGNIYNDVEYFGIDKNSDKELDSQVDVLYYNSQDDFAVILNTKQNDEVIFCKNPKGTNFREIYDNMNNEADKYTGDIKFQNIDELKIPNIKLNEKKEYQEVQGKEFATEKGTGIIVKAIQTIQFELNKKGGEIKSEAAMDPKEVTAAAPEPRDEPKPRYFYVDDTFVIFLREK